MASYWTDEEVELLRQLAAEGRSSSEMLKFFPNKTRNSIIGKMGRAKIKNISHYALLAAKREEANKRRGLMSKVAKKKKKKETHHFVMAEDIKRFITQPSDLVPTINVEPKTILELKSRDCRGIVSDVDGANTRYCAAPKKDGSSYCAFHHSKYYVLPARPRE